MSTKRVFPTLSGFKRALGIDPEAARTARFKARARVLVERELINAATSIAISAQLYFKSNPEAETFAIYKESIDRLFEAVKVARGLSRS